MKRPPVPPPPPPMADRRKASGAMVEKQERVKKDLEELERKLSSTSRPRSGRRETETEKERVADENAVALLALKRPLTQEEKRVVQAFMQRRKNYAGRFRSSAVSRSASATSESLYLQQRRRSRGRQRQQQQQHQEEEAKTDLDDSKRFVSRFIASEAANMAIAKLGVNGGQQKSRRQRQIDSNDDPEIVNRARVICSEMRESDGEVSYMKLMKKLNREFGKLTTSRHNMSILSVMSESTMTQGQIRQRARRETKTLEIQIQALKSELRRRDDELNELRKRLGMSPKSTQQQQQQQQKPSEPAGKPFQGLKKEYASLVKALKSIKKRKDIAGLAMKAPLGSRPSDVEPAVATEFVKEFIPEAWKTLQKELGKEKKATLKDLRKRLVLGMLALMPPPSSSLSSDSVLVLRAREIVATDPRYSDKNACGQTYKHIKSILVSEFGEDAFNKDKGIVSNILRAAVGLAPLLVPQQNITTSSSLSSSSKTGQETKQSVVVLDEKFNKYTKMLKMHIPSGAVEQKMRNDGFNDNDVDLFFGRKSTSSGPTASPSDPRFAKYFKMRKMHIPDGAIAQKMSADGLSPAEMAAFFGGGKAGSRLEKKKRKPRPFRTIFWEKLKSPNVQKRSLWVKPMEKFVEKAKLKKHFGRDMGKKKGGGSTPKKSSSSLSTPTLTMAKILSSDRVHTISIVISQIKCSSVELTRSLIRMDRSTWSLEIVERFLFDVKMTDAESRQLTSFKGSDRCLNKCELICRAVARVPRWQARLESLECLYTFSQELKQTTQSVLMLRKLVKEVRHSKRFPKLLHAVLELGNVVNQDTEYGNAKGFEINVILELVKSKSKCLKSYTMLDFVIESVERRVGADALNLCQDWPSAQDCNGANLHVLNKTFVAYEQEIQRLRSNLEMASKSKKKISGDEYVRVMTPFLKRAQEQFSCSKAIFDSLVKAFDECLDWFGYDIPAHKTEPRQQFLDSVLRIGSAVERAYKAIALDRASKLRNLAKLTTAKTSPKTDPRAALRRIRGAVGSISERPPVSRPDRDHKPLISMKKRVMLPTGLKKKKKKTNPTTMQKKKLKVAPPLPPRNGITKKVKKVEKKQETTYGLSTLWGLFA